MIYPSSYGMRLKPRAPRRGESRDVPGARSARAAMEKIVFKRAPCTWRARLLEVGFLNRATPRGGIVRKLHRNWPRNARHRPDQPLIAPSAAVTCRFVATHRDTCLCGACRSARAGDARRLELAERSRVYSRPVPCGCGCGELVVPGPSGADASPPTPAASAPTVAGGACPRRPERPRLRGSDAQRAPRGTVRRLGVGGNRGEVWAVADIYGELPDEAPLYFSIEGRSGGTTAPSSPLSP